MTKNQISQNDAVEITIAACEPIKTRKARQPKTVKTLRVVHVKVERLDERYCGAKTGRIVYHVSEHNGFSYGNVIKGGCPLGRGYTEASALADFAYRANLDDANLKLSTTELAVVDRKDYTVRGS